MFPQQPMRNMAQQVVDESAYKDGRKTVIAGAADAAGGSFSLSSRLQEHTEKRRHRRRGLKGMLSRFYPVQEEALPRPLRQQRRSRRRTAGIAGDSESGKSGIPVEHARQRPEGAGRGAAGYADDPAVLL